MKKFTILRFGLFLLSSFLLGVNYFYIDQTIQSICLGIVIAFLIVYIFPFIFSVIEKGH